MPLDFIHPVIAVVFAFVWLMVWHILSMQREDKHARPPSTRTKSPVLWQDAGPLEENELFEAKPRGDVQVGEPAGPTRTQGQTPGHVHPRPPLQRPLSVRNQKPSVHP